MIKLAKKSFNYLESVIKNLEDLSKIKTMKNTTKHHSFGVQEIVFVAVEEELTAYQEIRSEIRKILNKPFFSAVAIDRMPGSACFISKFSSANFGP